MLSSISWQHYLAAVIILTVSYYLYVVLRYYQSEIANLFNRKQGSSQIFAAVQSSPIEVMGEAKPDNGTAVTDTSKLQFTDTLPDEPVISANPQTNQPNILPSEELVKEAGNLIEAFKDIDNKQEFLTLLRILINSYKRFKEDIDLPVMLHRVVEISKNKLQFPIALSDLENTWA